MVFELRGKPFALRDSGRREGVYALCRNWMRGNDDERPREKREVEHPEPPDDSLVSFNGDNLDQLIYTRVIFNFSLYRSRHGRGSFLDEIQSGDKNLIWIIVLLWYMRKPRNLKFTLIRFGHLLMEYEAVRFRLSLCLFKFLTGSVYKLKKYLE